MNKDLQIGSDLEHIVPGPVTKGFKTKNYLDVNLSWHKESSSKLLAHAQHAKSINLEEIVIHKITSRCAPGHEQAHALQKIPSEDSF